MSEQSVSALAARPEHTLLLALAVVAASAVAALAAAVDVRVLLAVAGALGAWLILSRPAVALYALTLVTWLNLSDLAIEVHHAPSIDKPLILLALGAVLVRWWHRHEAPRIDAALLALLVAYGCSVAMSGFVASDVAIFTEEMTAVAKGLVLTLVVVALVRDASMGRIAVWGLLTAGLILGLTGTVQWLTASSEWNFGGLAQALEHQIVGEHDAPRLVGPLDDPNAYAQILVPLVPLAWNRLLNERALALRIVAGSVLMVVILALIGTYSRSALLALGVVVGIMVVLWHRHRPSLVLTVAAAVIAAGIAFLPGAYLERAGELFSFTPGVSDPGTDVALRGRSDEMSAALQMGLDHPILGVGVGHYVLHFQQYSNRLGLLPRREDRQAHSLYLELFAERGMVGLVAFLALCAVAAWRGVAAARRWGQAAEAQVMEALVLGLGAYLTFAVVLHRVYEHYFWLLLGLVLGLAGAATAHRRKDGVAEGRTGSPAVDV